MISLFQVLMSPHAHERVKEVLYSGYIAQGKTVDDFEIALEKILGRRPVTVNSGTSALELALHLAGVGPGTETITTPMTCLTENAYVRLADGTCEQIGRIVKQRLTPMVLSMAPDGKLEPRRVIGWVKRDAADVNWFRIRCMHAAGVHGLDGKRGVFITGDHRILTRRGYVRVDELQPTDEVATAQRQPNAQQREVIDGTLLGDGYITLVRKTYSRFALTHTAAQDEWLRLKLNALHGLQVRVCAVAAHGASKPAVKAESAGGVYWRAQRQRWYSASRQKIVPDDLVITPRVLTTWFLDDGHFEAAGGAIFCTEGFSPDSVWKLFWKLNDCGFHPRVYKHKESYRIRILVAECAAFFALIGAYVPPSMRYKVPDDAPEFNPELWDLGEAEPAFDSVVTQPVVRPPSWTKPAFAYCLEVEDNHNFVVADMVVSNCAATTAAIVSRGGRPVWADIGPWTGNIDPADVACKITKRTAAIVAVDWGGRPCDYTALRACAGTIPIIEDAAHAFGTTYQGEPLVKWGGDYQAYSFQAVKFLTTGDGGALITPTGEDARARRLRWFGIDRSLPEDVRWLRDLPEPGFKYHMNNIAAAIGLANLPLALEAVEKQREHARTYCDEFQGLEHVFAPPWDEDASWWVYTVRVKERDKFIAYMKTNGIAASPVHARNDKHSGFSYYNGPLPGVDAFAAENVCIPVHWALSTEHVTAVIDAVVRYRP